MLICRPIQKRHALDNVISKQVLTFNGSLVKEYL